jgi:acyl-coenzyme A synthetase/AMP-(fatty) acid ligase
MTVGELFDRAIGLRERLLEVVGRQGRVCLVSENRAVVACTLLASATGGPGLVVPYALSTRIIKEVCEVTNATVAVLDRDRELPAGMQGMLVGEVPRGESRGRLRLEPPDDTILWIYTGGTTGQPKLWPKTIRNLFAEAANLRRRFGIDTGDTILATVPPLHVYGLLFSVILPLLSGARVVNPTPYFPREIEKNIQEHRVTVLVSSPVHFKVMATTSPGRLTLRLAFSSGGFLAEEDGASFHRQTGTGVVEVYGSTETGGIATRCRADGEKTWQAFDDVRCRIRDDRLAVSSPFLSPDLTLTPDGHFVTGDRAGPAEGGRFHLLGRADGVVKVGGKRVVLDEVKTKIASLDGVLDALVLSLPAPDGRENQIVALVEGNGEEKNLRRAIGEILEPHAVPRQVRIVSRLPLTPMGKPDIERARQLLAQPENASGQDC